MTTCASIDFELDNLREQMNDTRSLINKWISSSNNSENPNALKSYADFLTKLMLDAAQEFNIAKSLQQQAERIGCGPEALKAAKLANEASGLQQQAMQGEQAAKEKANRIERETTQATTSQNNAGDGTPGSAPASNPAQPSTSDPTDIDNEPLPQDINDDFSDEEFGLEEPPTVSDEELGIDPEEELFEAEKAAALAEAEAEELFNNTNVGLGGEINRARAQATQQDVTNFKQKEDWRVRLSLSPGAYYLYKDESNELLAPLRGTDGIVFPYTPTINVTYGANYQSVAPVHSNYKIFQYENSFVDSITITCDFTAQDSTEARYMLAVIHFLKSVTKMFYGQDFDPKPGTPPPLCYLFGLGEFQFNAHPLAITNFTYNLPPDVDYIRAGEPTQNAGTSRAEVADQKKSNDSSLGSIIQNQIQSRLNQGIAAVGNALGLKLQPGGLSQGYKFGTSNRFNSPVPPGTVEPTYVPTKININISAIPIVSRYDISNRFSIKDYANGTLLQGVKQQGGGIW